MKQNISELEGTVSESIDSFVSVHYVEGYWDDINRFDEEIVEIGSTVLEGEMGDCFYHCQEIALPDVDEGLG